MFLNQLMKSNKEDFLRICVYASLANGVFAEEEKNMLFAYCREMDIKEEVPDTAEPFEILISRMQQNTTNKEKKIITLEILALMKTDGLYDEKEHSFMENLITGLGLSHGTLYQLDELLNRYIEVGAELYNAIAE